MLRILLTSLAIASLTLSTHAAAPEPAPSRERTTTHLARRVSIEISSRPLREAVPIVAELSGLKLQPLWLDSRHDDGLDPDMQVSISVSNESVLTLLERLIDAADMSGASTWQVTSSGTVQFGPRSRLNIFKRVQIYDITDLIKITPDHRQTVSIDLQQALQATGTSAPLTETNRGREGAEEAPRPIDRAREVADLIRSLIETDQWNENGGEGGTIQFYQNSLIVNAPDYMHRGIAGSRPR